MWHIGEQAEDVKEHVENCKNRRVAKMGQIDSYTKDCSSCCHFGFCVVYWNADCKRQGGSRIPRLKSHANKVKFRIDKMVSEQPKRANEPPQRSMGKTKPKQQINMFEPIRTKAANWEVFNSDCHPFLV